MVYVISSPMAMNSFERHPTIHTGLNGQGFRDMLRGLKRSFGRIVKPSLRRAGRDLKNYAVDRVAPNVSDFVQNTVLPEGTNLLRSSIESKMRGQPVNFRQNLGRTASRVGQKAQRRAIEQYKDASQAGTRIAKREARSTLNRANRQKGRVAKQATKNLQKGNNKTAKTVGSFMDQAMKGSGLYRY